MTALTLLPEIQTAHLILRELALEDKKPFTRYMTRVPYQQFLAVRYSSREAISHFVNRAVARQARTGRSHYHLAGVCKRTGVVRADGFIMFHEPAAAEIGWGVDPDRWGRGLGTEVARALSALAVEWLEADHVWCKVMARNTASMKVAQKAGFKRDRLVAAYDREAGMNMDVHVFTMTKDSYFDTPY